MVKIKISVLFAALVTVSIIAAVGTFIHYRMAPDSWGLEDGDKMDFWEWFALGCVVMQAASVILLIIWIWSLT